MSYFLQRGADFARCEINEGDTSISISITEPGGAERTDAFSTSDEAAVASDSGGVEQRGLVGPHGRD